MIHSPMPGIGWTFHSPAGMAYRPQWMKRPNLASRNHCMRSSCDLGGSFLMGCPNAAQTANRAMAAFNDKCWGFISDSLFPHKRDGNASGRKAQARRPTELHQVV